MPGFLEKLKSGAEKASFEAERLVRVSQAQSALNTLQRDLESRAATLGKKVLELYDAGSLTQPELLADCQEIDALRQKISDQEAEVERIRQEKPPQHATPEEPAEAEATPLPQPVAAPRPVTPAPVAEPSVPAGPASGPGRTCPSCHSSVPEGVRFCPECGARLEGPSPSAGPTACPSCGNAVQPGVAFCPECGTRLRSD